MYLDSSSALAQLRRSLVWPRLGQPGARIVFDERALGPKAKRAETQVNALYRACGCRVGALAVVTMAAGLAVSWAYRELPLDSHALVVAAGALVAAALGGKAVGIVQSRVRLWFLLQRLEQERYGAWPQ